MSYNATDIQKRFGENIKKLRTDKGMSQLELSINADIEKTAVSRIENGRTNVTLKTALQLSQALNIELKQLFDF